MNGIANIENTISSLHPVDFISTDFTYAQIIPYPPPEFDVEGGHSNYILFSQRISRKMYPNTLKSPYIFRTDY